MSSSPDRSASATTRRRYIDWARGIAVLIMIEAHVLDSWTLRSERSTTAFGLFNLLGGLAAPLFLWLAGLALVLSAERALVRGGDRGEAASAVLRRGIEIFVLAFLFRLQAFIVSPGNPLVSLLRVDILNIMGPAMVVAALLWRVAPNARMAAALCAGAATALALVTPVARNAPWLPVLPPPVQWYISPNGNHSTFILFPWAGFVFAGAACGALLAQAGMSRERRAVAGLGAVGGLVIALCYYASTLPSIYATSSFWTTSPTYFGIRTGLLMMALWGLSGLTSFASRAPGPFAILERFGRHSLFVYWIHVELVYGYATLLVHHRLPLWGTAIGYVVFCCAMYWAIALKERIVGWWRSRTPSASTPQTLGA